MMMMTALAVWMVVQATVNVPVVEAAACCQDCEAQEAAAYQACANGSHENCSGLQACYDEVDQNLMHYCFSHCIYCSNCDEGADAWCGLIESDPHNWFCGGDGGCS